MGVRLRLPVPTAFGALFRAPVSCSHALPKLSTAHGSRLPMPVPLPLVPAKVDGPVRELAPATVTECGRHLRQPARAFIARSRRLTRPLSPPPPAILPPLAPAMRVTAEAHQALALRPECGAPSPMRAQGLYALPSMTLRTTSSGRRRTLFLLRRVPVLPASRGPRLVSVPRWAHGVPLAIRASPRFAPGILHLATPSGLLPTRGLSQRARAFQDTRAPRSAPVRFQASGQRPFRRLASATFALPTRSRMQTGLPTRCRIPSPLEHAWLGTLEAHLSSAVLRVHGRLKCRTPVFRMNVPPSSRSTRNGALLWPALRM